MVEEFLCFGARLWASAQANAFFDRAIDQFFLGGGSKYDVERFVGRGFIDLFEP